MDPRRKPDKDVPTLCLDCCALECTGQPGHRHLRHPELPHLTIAHVDCDAFYASVEKRDRPELAGRPVIVGGGRRGVVTTACYVARISGVRSAMPMFKALTLCPDAVVIRPDFAKYAEAARQLRRRMERLTPLVQPLSIDEAVLDLAGTDAVHGAPPAVMLARLARLVETECGITISIGLAPNRLLAKLAAERAKPRGFTVLGADAGAVLAGETVGILPGVGPVQVRRLAARGIVTLADLQRLTDHDARTRLGPDGPALAAQSRGVDHRVVQTTRTARSVSAETTFEHDLSRIGDLEHKLWQVSERLAARLRDAGLAAGDVTLKLKTSRFALRTRSRRLPFPSQLPDTLFSAARSLLLAEANGTAFRLVGIGTTMPLPGTTADRGDLADPDMARRVARQAAVDSVRARFGAAAIKRGRAIVPG